jgi:hypothetical protein
MPPPPFVLVVLALVLEGAQFQTLTTTPPKTGHVV